MDPSDNERTTAIEIVAFGRSRGFDLESLRNDSLFRKNQRWVFFWRKLDRLPCSGTAAEKDGTLHYNLQGATDALSNRPNESSKPVQEGWTESGILDSIESAFELLKAWLLDEEAVDALPQRLVRRSGIA